jgi:hypothetical protein
MDGHSTKITKIMNIYIVFWKVLQGRDFDGFILKLLTDHFVREDIED